MMKGPSILSLIICGVLSTVGAVSAEVRITQEGLSIKADAMPIQDLLDDLSQHGMIRVTVLEKEALKGEKVSAQFEGFPIEEGLARLFAHWNYGLTRNKVTGHIQEIFLASKRLKLSNPPSSFQPSLASLSVHHQETPLNVTQYGETLAASFQKEGLHEYNTEEFEGFDETQPFMGDQELPKNPISQDLPFELRDALLQDVVASREIQKLNMKQPHHSMLIPELPPSPLARSPAPDKGIGL